MAETLKNDGTPSEGSKRRSSVEVEYGFASGHVFRVGINEDSTLFAKFYLGRKMMFDFSSLLPEGWVFADEEYVRTKARETHFNREITPGWKVIPELGVVQFLVFMEGRKDILSLLHEIGHARHDGNVFKVKRQFSKGIESAQEQMDFDTEIILSKEEAPIVSLTERNAWAYAVYTLKNILKNIGINIREFFPDNASLKSFYHEYLESYSYYIYSRVAEKDPSFASILDNLFVRKKTS